MNSEKKRLQGTVTKVEPTDTTKVINGERWRKVILTLGSLRFSKRVREEILENWKNKKVKLTRYTLYDWHSQVGARKTLTIEETEAVLDGQIKETVLW